MPIVNGTGAFNTGKDVTIIFNGPYGQVQLDNVMGFDAAQKTATITVDRLDGVQMNAELPKGWSGSFDLERGSSTVDDLLAQIENDWLTNGNYLVSTLYQYILETNGSTSTYMFTNVAIKLSNAGSYKGDSSVRQRIEFMANQRKKVS